MENTFDGETCIDAIAEFVECAEVDYLVYCSLYPGNMDHLLKLGESNPHALTAIKKGEARLEQIINRGCTLGILMGQIYTKFEDIKNRIKVIQMTP